MLFSFGKHDYAFFTECASREKTKKVKNNENLEKTKENLKPPQKLEKTMKNSKTLAETKTKVSP